MRKRRRALPDSRNFKVPWLKSTAGGRQRALCCSQGLAPVRHRSFVFSCRTTESEGRGHRSGPVREAAAVCGPGRVCDRPGGGGVTQQTAAAGGRPRAAAGGGPAERSRHRGYVEPKPRRVCLRLRSAALFHTFQWRTSKTFCSPEGKRRTQPPGRRTQPPGRRTAAAQGICPGGRSPSGATTAAPPSSVRAQA